MIRTFPKIIEFFTFKLEWNTQIRILSGALPICKIPWLFPDLEEKSNFPDFSLTSGHPGKNMKINSRENKQVCSMQSRIRSVFYNNHLRRKCQQDVCNRPHYVSSSRSRGWPLTSLGKCCSYECCHLEDMLHNYNNVAPHLKQVHVMS